MHLTALLLAALAALSQASMPPVPAADGKLVLLRFQATKQRGQFVKDLRAEDVEVMVDGAAQKLAVFEGPNSKRTIPLGISILFDCSVASLNAGVPDPRLFQESLLSQREDAAISLYTFGNTEGLIRLAPFTRDLEILRRGMSAALHSHPTGTFLLEQIRRLASPSPGATRAVHMLVVISDGHPDYAPVGEGARRDRYDATVRAAQDANMTVFPVLLRTEASGGGFYEGGGGRNGGLASSSVGGEDAPRTLGDFKDLGKATGGEHFEPLGGSNPLPALLKSIAKLIQDEYVVGFTPASAGEAKRHKVEIVVRDKNLGKPVKGTRTLVY